MILRYAGYSFQDAECLPVFYGRARTYNARGRAQFIVKRLTIEGEIIAATQALIDARVREIENALAVEGGTAVLLLDSGAESAYKLDGGSSVSGVKIIDGPNFPQEEAKAHYATGQPFNMTFEAEYLISDFDPLVSFSESITKIGNAGPRVVWPELDNGQSIPQIVSTHTNVTIIQAGSAVGVSGYPFAYAPPPIFPQNLDNPDETTTVESPQLTGLGFQNFTLNWVYRMTLNANPGIVIPTAR